MNISKVTGTFPTFSSLLLAILKEFFQYDYEYESIIGDLLHFQVGLFKVQVFDDYFIVTFVEKTKAKSFSEPHSIHSRIDFIVIDAQKSFPLEVSATSPQLRTLLQTENLSLFLKNLKSMVSAALLNNLSLELNQEESQKQEERVLSGTKHEAPKVIDRAIYQERWSTFGSGGVPLASVGQSDLDPGFGRPAFGSGGGMIVGPDHPMFTGGDSNQGGGFVDPFNPIRPQLPFGSVPPGARFDPITPFGPQPGFPNRPMGGVPHPSRNRRPFR